METVILKTFIGFRFVLVFVKIAFEKIRIQISKKIEKTDALFPSKIANAENIVVVAICKLF